MLDDSAQTLIDLTRVMRDNAVQSGKEGAAEVGQFVYAIY